MIRSSARGLTARSWRTARRFCVWLLSGAAGLLLLNGAVFGRSIPFPTMGAIARSLTPPSRLSDFPLLIELTQRGFTAQALPHDCAGGMDFLPDGDMVCMDSATRLYAFDANGDGIPAKERTIARLSKAGLFGAFVKTTPDGQSLLVAESSIGQIFLVNLVTGVVQKPVRLFQPFDAAFLSNTEAIISASPTGTGTVLYHYDLSTGALRPVAQVSGPSGPVALDAAGNLYYVRSTFEFPAPPASHALLKFDHTLVAEALQGLRVLQESDAQTVAALDSGFDLVLNNFGDFFVTNLFGVLDHIARDSHVSPFAQTTGGSFALFLYAALYRPDAPFQPFHASPSRVAFFIDDLGGHRQVIVVRPAKGGSRPTKGGSRP